MKVRAFFTKAAFSLWVFLASVCTVALMARHLVALPAPGPQDGQMADALQRLRHPEEQGKLLAVHVLYSECRCSLRIVDHLVTRARPQGVSELVLLAGPPLDLAERLEAAGFRVLQLKEEALQERFHIESAPLMVVLSPTGDVRYAGGYTTQKQGLDIQDLSILEGARTAGVAPLPVLGCAVSQRLQKLLNPLGLL